MMFPPHSESAAKSFSEFDTVRRKTIGEQIESPATIAASRKASCTSSDVTWRDVRVAVDRPFTASATTMIRFIEEPRTKT
jgi:hypothetical protein